MGRKEKYGIRDGFDLKYQKKLVAFLDLLGFEKMVVSRMDDDVDFVVNLIPDMLKTHVGNSLRKDLQVTTVSDSIIISLNTSVEDAELKDLWHLSVIIGRLQHELALNGYYMRGAITVGDFCHDSDRNILVGPAFIGAYVLEKEKAVVPRVIVDSKVNDFYGFTNKVIATTINHDFTEYFYQGNLIKDTSDIESLKVNEFDLFIDYVSSIRGRALHGFTENQVTYLKKLSDAIESGIETTKYKWLANYTLNVFRTEKTTLDDESKGLISHIETLVR